MIFGVLEIMHKKLFLEIMLVLIESFNDTKDQERTCIQKLRIFFNCSFLAFSLNWVSFSRDFRKTLNNVE